MACDYDWITKIAADDVSQLRAIDLDRVMQAAMDRTVEHFPEFVKWLATARPDLSSRIQHILAEMVCELSADILRLTAAEG